MAMQPGNNPPSYWKEIWTLITILAVRASPLVADVMLIALVIWLLIRALR